jgi:hypothetical protein
MEPTLQDVRELRAEQVKQGQTLARLEEAMRGVQQEQSRLREDVVERLNNHSGRLRALEFWRYGLVTGWAMLAGAGVALWTFIRGS